MNYSTFLFLKFKISKTMFNCYFIEKHLKYFLKNQILICCKLLKITCDKIEPSSYKLGIKTDEQYFFFIILQIMNQKKNIKTF